MDKSTTLKYLFEELDYLLFEMGQLFHIAYCNNLPNHSSQANLIQNTESDNPQSQTVDIEVPSDPIAELSDLNQNVKSIIGFLVDWYESLKINLTEETTNEIPLAEIHVLILQLQELTYRCETFTQYIEGGQNYDVVELEKHSDLIFATKDKLRCTLSFIREHYSAILDQTISLK